MKRPLFIAAALVLSGMVCGIKESGLTMKAAAVIMTAVLIVMIISGYFEGDNPLIFVRTFGKDRSKYKSNDNHKAEQQKEQLHQNNWQHQAEQTRLYDWLLRDNKKNYTSNCTNRVIHPANEKIRFCLAAIALAIFLLGFARGAVQSHIYNTPECTEFYEYYKPTNPGLFDYSLYLKSLDISSRAEFEAYKDASGTKNSSKSRNDKQAQGSELTQKESYSKNKDAGKYAAYGRADTAESADFARPADSADMAAADADIPPVICMLDAVKEHCAGIFDATLSEHDSGIYKAVILGDKSDMDTEIRDLYQDAGIAHLLAVSGLHVSMIGASLYNILRRKLNARKSAIAASIVLFMYMLMTGASGSVIRAVIMLILNIAAAVIGRNYCMTTAISISAIAVMLYRPYMIFTSGFQLSFGAVASISLISKNIIKRIELLLENSECSDKIINQIMGKQTSEERTAKLDFTGRSCHKIEDNQPKGYPEQSDVSDAKLTKYIRHSNRLKAPIKAFIVSASIQLGTLPIIAYHFYKIPVYGILLNFIVIPLMAAVIASGMSLIGIWTAVRTIKGIADTVLLLMSNMALLKVTDAAASELDTRILLLPLRLLTAAAAAPGHYVLLFYERLSSMSLKLPYATVCIGRPVMLQIIVYYLILAAVILWIIRPRRLQRRRITAVSMIFLAAVIFNTNVLRYRDTSKLYVTAIDVGQGDSFLIKKGRHAILIDGGSSSRSNIGKNVIESFLMAKGITKLSAIAVSHADSDHINGIEYLLSDESDISTGALILPIAAENDTDYNCLKSLFLYGEAEAEGCEANDTNINDKAGETGRKGDADKNAAAFPDKQMTGNTDKQHILYPQRGSVVCQTGDFSLYCLYPGHDGEDKNRHSLVLLLKSGDFTMLFTGDTEAADEGLFTDEAYLSNLGLGDIFGENQLTVLKAAHHGSHSANSEDIFDTFKPQAVLISCGKNNRYGHPHEDVLERAESAGSRILRTDASGAVSIYVDDDRIRVERYKQ